jgi:Collagen triple helix repeat (20 copies)
MRAFVTRRGWRLLFATVAVLTVSGGIAWAAIPDENGVFTACISNADGSIRMIDPSQSGTAGTCTGTENRVSWNKKGIEGPKGPAGATGAQGPRGAQGAPGPAGGPPGPQGDTGPAGPKGDTGATGAQGPAGGPGPKGDTGATGAPGATGATGPAGAQGPKGDTGAAGATGPQGAAGPGALWALVRSDGVKVNGSVGVTTSHGHAGVYEIVFPQPVTLCGSSVTSSQYVGSGLIGVNPDFADPPDTSHAFFSVYFRSGSPSHIVIAEFDKGGTAVDGPFTISMLCQ